MLSILENTQARHCTGVLPGPVPLTHMLSGVPSSANWNPTKPLSMSAQQTVHMRPVCTAANHCQACPRAHKVPTASAAILQPPF